MTFRRLVLLASVASLQVLVPTGTSFAWQANGTPVCIAPGVQQFPSGIPDGTGGAFIVWLDARTGSRVFLQRLLADGSVALGWPIGGLPLTISSGAIGPPRIFPDGTGGVLALFEHGGPRVQRVDANGLIHAGFPVDGKLLEVNFFEITPISAPDGTGGAYFAGLRFGVGPSGFQTEPIVERVDSSGNLVWSPNGVTVVFGDQGGRIASLEPYPSGGVIWSGWVHRDLQTDQINAFVGRLRANGSQAQLIGLPAPLSGNVVPGIVDEYGTSDVAHGILGVWRDQAPGPPFSLAGDFAARWDSASVHTEWTIPNAQGSPLIPIADGTSGGGGYLVGKPVGDNSLVAFRRTAAGGFPPGWTAAGIPLSESDATSGSAVGVISGSLIVCWAESFGAGDLDLRATLLMPNGTLPAGWPAGGMNVCTATGHQDFPRLIVNPGVSAIVVWEDQRTNAITQTDIYAQMLPIEVVAVGEVRVEVPLPHRLAVEPARPNPSSGAVTLSYTLASAAPARLEMFDLSGRRVFAREIAAPSAGRHLLRVDQAFAPGVYLVRLTQDGGSASGRVVRAE